MSRTVDARLAALEKVLQVDAQRSYALSQLLQVVELDRAWREEHPGVEPSPELQGEWWVSVGPPSVVLAQGQPSLEELMSECFAAARA